VREHGHEREVLQCLKRVSAALRAFVSFQPIAVARQHTLSAKVLDNAMKYLQLRVVLVSGP